MSKQRIEKNYGYKYQWNLDAHIQKLMDNWLKKKKSKQNQCISSLKYSIQIEQRIEK